MVVPVVLNDEPVPAARKADMVALWQQHMRDVLEVIYAFACPPNVLRLKGQETISVDDFFNAISQCSQLHSSIYGPLIRRYLEGSFNVAPPSTLLPMGLPLTDEVGKPVEGARPDATRRHRVFAAADSAMLMYDDVAPKDMKRELGWKSPVCNPWEINFPSFMKTLIPGFQLFL